MHSLRHVFVSLLIEQGHDVVYISRQVGHAKPSITTDVYGHLFDKRSRDEATRAALEADYGSLVEHRPASPAVAAGGELVQIEAFRE